MVDIGEAYFLHELKPRELDRIRSIARSREVEPDATVVSVGDEVHCLFVIARGQVRVVVPIERDSQVDEEILERMGPGQCFGEFSFVDRRPASASIVAEQATQLHELPFVELDRLMASDPKLALKLVRAMLATVVERMRSTDADLAMARYVLRYL